MNTNMISKWNILHLPARALKPQRVPIIALEGNNGAGKSTIAAMLCDYFKIPHHFGVPMCFLNNGMKFRMIADASWAASALYFLAGSNDKIRELRNISGDNVFHLMERSLWSTLSAHVSEDPERLETLISILSLMDVETFEPDFTIILNGSFEHCVSRIQLKTDLEEFELDQLITYEDYYIKERQFYSWLGRQRQGRIQQIEVTGRESIDVFNHDVLPAINDLLASGMKK